MWGEDEKDGRFFFLVWLEYFWDVVEINGKFVIVEWLMIEKVIYF